MYKDNIFNIKLSGSWPKKKSIFIANHISFFDGLLLVFLIPSRLNPIYAIMNEYNVGLWRLGTKLLEFLGFGKAVSIDSEKPMKIRSLLKFYNNDRSLVIFPQGAISRNGEIKNIKKGIHWLVDRTNSEVTPVTIKRNGFFSFDILVHDRTFLSEALPIILEESLY